MTKKKEATEEKEVKVRTLKSIFNTDKGTKDAPALSSYLFGEDESEPEWLSTNVITLNLGFSGKVDGGIAKGKLAMISAPSMLGKSFVATGLCKNAQKKGMQIVIIDTERAFSYKLARSLGIDVDDANFMVVQENSIEEVRGIIMKICNQIPKSERKNILFVIDSWGSMVTSKTLKDASTGNDVVDMTEAKKKNQLANILLNTRATYFIVNHVYDNTGGVGDPLLIPGGRKVVFNSDSVVLGESRAKEKNAAKTEVTGYIVSFQTFKSRYSEANMKMKFRIKKNGGLDPFYGIHDDALEGGYIEKNSSGKYWRPCIKDDKQVGLPKIFNADFWLPVFKQTDFKQYLEEKYKFKSDLDIMTQKEAVEEIENVVQKEQ